MELSFQQIKTAVCGVSYLDEQGGAITFHRFTKEQEERYRGIDAGDALRTFATAGVELRFCTDSRTLRLGLTVSPGSSRNFFAVDVFENGKLLGSLDNLADPAHPLGDYSAAFALSEGEKEIRIVFPWSVKVQLKALTLTENASFYPAVPQKRLLTYGDSITQGYDVQHPSNRYTAVLAQMLGCEERCKAIGGAFFTPWLAESAENFAPDYITVAYGTNDWNVVTAQELKETAAAFLAALRKKHPDTPIFLLAPIIRTDAEEKRSFGPFEQIAAVLKEAAAAFWGVEVIDAIDFIPKDPVYFADARVHPNEKGMECYSKALCAEIRTGIEE